MNIYQDRFLPLFQRLGMNDQQIEQEIGLPRGILYDWKKGRTKSYQKYIPQIASYFHVSTDYLLGNTDDPSPVGQKEKPPAQGGELSKEESALIELFRRIPREQRSAMLQAIEMTLRSQGLL